MKTFYWIIVPLLGFLSSAWCGKVFFAWWDARSQSDQINNQESLNKVTLSTSKFEQTPQRTTLIRNKADAWLDKSEKKIREAIADNNSRSATVTEKFDSLWNDFQSSAQPIIAAQLSEEEIERLSQEKSSLLVQKEKNLKTELIKIEEARNLVEGGTLIRDILAGDKEAQAVLPQLNK